MRGRRFLYYEVSPGPASPAQWHSVSRGLHQTPLIGNDLAEQPELHVHPAVQVGMGDLFIRAVRADPDQVRAGKSLLIETHSEHILLATHQGNVAGVNCRQVLLV